MLIINIEQISSKLEADIKQTFTDNKEKEILLVFNSTGGDFKVAESLSRYLLRLTLDGYKFHTHLVKAESSAAFLFTVVMGWGSLTIDNSAYLLFHDVKIRGFALTKEYQQRQEYRNIIINLIKSKFNLSHQQAREWLIRGKLILPEEITARIG